MSRYLAREDRKITTVLVVFYSPCSVEQLDFPFIDAQGQERRISLTSFQGFIAPDKPLSAMTWSERERVYTRLAERIRELVQSQAPAVTNRPRLPPSAFRPARTTSAPPSESAYEYPLTIHLEPYDNTCNAHYVLLSGYVIDVELDWQHVRPRLETLQTVLNDTDDPTHLARDMREEYGPVLFDTLFGEVTHWEPVLRRLFNQPEPAPRPNPIRAPVRVRICTDDTLLLGMPWRLTTWNNYQLATHGWEVTTTQVLQPTDSYTTTAPANILIVAPQTTVDGMPLDPMHPQAICDVLQQVWPTGQEARYVRTVRTRQELEHALRGMRPHLVYVYGHGVVCNAANQVCF